jgi:hypothetical protein
MSLAVVFESAMAVFDIVHFLHTLLLKVKIINTGLLNTSHHIWEILKDCGSVVHVENEKSKDLNIWYKFLATSKMICLDHRLE